LAIFFGIHDFADGQTDLDGRAQERPLAADLRSDARELSFVATRSASRLRARSAANSRLRHTISRSPGKSGELISAKSRSSNSESLQRAGLLRQGLDLGRTQGR